jgi:hypothetical protein
MGLIRNYAETCLHRFADLQSDPVISAFKWYVKRLACHVDEQLDRLINASLSRQPLQSYKLCRAAGEYRSKVMRDVFGVEPFLYLP